MAYPSVLPALALAALIACPHAAAARATKPTPTKPSPTEAWVSMVVTKITRAGTEGADAGLGGTVAVRVRIGAGGAVEGAAVEGGSGSADLDARALKAVTAASPFAPPPETLLTLEGFTELSFPLTLGRPASK